MPSNRIRALAMATVFALNQGSVAQQPPKTTVPNVPGVERIEVRLAQFDVVVRDRSGKIVPGLGASDFKVLEDGSPLEVVAVDEWGRPEIPPPPRPPTTTASPSVSPSADQASGAPADATPTVGDPPSPPGTDSPDAEHRSFVIVFDGLGESTALRMNQAKKAATNFVRSRFRSGDLGAVYQLDLSLRPMSGITSNRDELARGIDRVAWMPASSLADQVNESVLAYANQGNAAYQQERLANQARNVTGQLDWQREHVYDRLTDVAAVFQGMPGKRVLVLVSSGFPLTTAGDLKTQTGGFTPKFQRLIKSLATYGVTVFSLDIGNDLSMGDAGAAIDWRVAVGKLGMDENVLSDLGLERTLGTSSASSRREFLGVIAAETGGRMLTDTDLGKSFNAVDEESTHFYRISCRVPVTRDTNRYRKFKVTIGREGLQVSSRRGRYSDVTPFELRPKPASANAVESLARYRPLTVQGVAAPLPAGASEKIPVAVVMRVLGPIDFTADPQGRGNLDLEVRIVARAADEIVARYERSFTARIPTGRVDSVRRAFRIEGRLDLVPGLYEVQGTVRLAAPAQVGTWTGTLAVPPQSKTGAPSILGPLLATDGDAAALVLSSPPVAEAADPLTVKPGARLLPAPTTDFAVGDSLTAMFWLRGFGETADGTPDLDMAVTVIDAGGAAAKAPSQLIYFAPDAGGGYRAIARVDCGALDVGSYNLQIVAGRKGTSPLAARRSTPFSLHARDADPAPAPAPAPAAAPTPPATSSSAP